MLSIRVVQCILLMATVSTARADESRPPPTSPTTAIPMVTFGLIPVGKSLFASYETGVQTVGTQFFPSIWYHFSVGNGEARAIGVFRSFRTGPEFDASYTLFDQRLNRMGPLNAGDLVLDGGGYYIQITAGHQTKFHFGIVGHPAKKFFNNDAGRTEDTALCLGPLRKLVTHSNDFYTYYTRQDVASGSASPNASEMIPDFSAPDPAIQTEFYTFMLSGGSSLKVISIGQDDDTYVIHLRGSSPSAILKGGQSVRLDAGTYILEIFDKLTQVGGGGTMPVFRDPHAENYEHHAFELLLDDVASVPPNQPPATPEVSPLGPPPHPACIQIGSQRIGC